MASGEKVSDSRTKTRLAHTKNPATCNPAQRTFTQSDFH